jgi:capsule biosynthesis phosphatase
MAKITLAEKTIVCDVDHTILFTHERDYDNSLPNHLVCEKLREAKKLGWYIILHTARGMGRSGGDIEKVRKEVVDEIIGFCDKYNVPFDELVLGKPWGRWYIDDKALRPDEFVNLDFKTVPEVEM